MNLKPKPWWLALLTPRLAWVTLYPYIYFPATAGANNPPVYAHESKHLEQQRSGKWRWLLKYFLSRKFRFSQEVEAIRAEVALLPEWQKQDVTDVYVELLSSRYYFWCASRERARAALTQG